MKRRESFPRGHLQSPPGLLCNLELPSPIILAQLHRRFLSSTTTKQCPHSRASSPQGGCSSTQGPSGRDRGWCSDLVYRALVKLGPLHAARVSLVRLCPFPKPLG